MDAMSQVTDEPEKSGSPAISAPKRGLRVRRVEALMAGVLFVLFGVGVAILGYYNSVPSAAENSAAQAESQASRSYFEGLDPAYAQGTEVAWEKDFDYAPEGFSPSSQAELALVTGTVAGQGMATAYTWTEGQIGSAKWKISDAAASGCGAWGEGFACVQGFLDASGKVTSWWEYLQRQGTDGYRQPDQGASPLQLIQRGQGDEIYLAQVVEGGTDLWHLRGPEDKQISSGRLASTHLDEFLAAWDDYALYYAPQFGAGQDAETPQYQILHLTPGNPSKDQASGAVLSLAGDSGVQILQDGVLVSNYEGEGQAGQSIISIFDFQARKQWEKRMDGFISILDYPAAEAPSAAQVQSALEERPKLDCSNRMAVVAGTHPAYLAVEGDQAAAGLISGGACPQSSELMSDGRVRYWAGGAIVGQPESGPLYSTQSGKAILATDMGQVVSAYGRLYTLSGNSIMAWSPVGK